MRRTMRQFLIAMILCTLTISAAPAFADTTSSEAAKAGQVPVSGSLSASPTDVGAGADMISAGETPGDGSDASQDEGVNPQPGDSTGDGTVNESPEGTGTEGTGTEGDGTNGDGTEGDGTGNEELPPAPEPGWTPEMGLPDVTTPAAAAINDTQLLVTWTGAEDFDGYQVSYAKNCLFLRDKKVKWEAAEVSAADGTAEGYSCHAQVDVKTGKRLYIRIRGYRTYEGDTYYSSWATTKTSGGSSAAIRFVKSGGSKLDVRKQAWSDLQYYSISQGSCSDGSYLYMCFEQRNGDDNGSGRARIKIAKVRISDWTVVKVSPSGQKLGHANDITYNPDQEYLVVTGAKTNDPYVRLVSPDTLKKIGRKKIKLGTTFSYVKAFNAIDYDAESKTYYIRSRFYGSKCFTLDQNFRIISDATMPTVYQTRSVQSCTSLGDYFILSQSWYQSSTKNTVTIFDKAGNMIQNIQLKMKGELESLFLIGNQLYATMHKHVTRSYMTGFIFRILL